MSRRVIGCFILLMVILQGMVQVSAAALPAVHIQQHCAGHDSAQDCACCAAGMAMTGGCTSLCSVSMVVALVSLLIPHSNNSQHSRLSVHGAFGPAYLPLNPPPIV
jgi:hypothetical protein